jgi:hypothetical protein
MFAKGHANQRGAVYSCPVCSSIAGPKQLRIQDHLDGFHVVEDTQQSIGHRVVTLDAGVIRMTRTLRSRSVRLHGEAQELQNADLRAVAGWRPVYISCSQNPHPHKLPSALGEASAGWGGGGSSFNPGYQGPGALAVLAGNFCVPECRSFCTRAGTIRLRSFIPPRRSGDQALVCVRLVDSIQG